MAKGKTLGGGSVEEAAQRTIRGSSVGAAKRREVDVKPVVLL